jgi:hypothetical protein
MMSQKASPKVVYFTTSYEGFLCWDMTVLLYKKNAFFHPKPLFSIPRNATENQYIEVMNKDASDKIAFCAS